MGPLLDERRLREQSGAPRPELFRDIARRWIADVPDAVGRIRGAPPRDLAAALHELRSGAVAVGLTELPGALAAIEQGVERGRPAEPDDLAAALALAERSAAALGHFWEAAAAY